MSKRIVKSILVLGVAICSVVGSFAFSQVLSPGWLSFNNSNTFSVPNSNINPPIWFQFLNGNFVSNNNPLNVINVPNTISNLPTNGTGNIVPPGGIVSPQIATIWLTKNGAFPQIVAKPVGITIGWKNVSNQDLTVAPVATNTTLSMPSFVVPVGGVFTYTFNTQGSLKYQVFDLNNIQLGDVNLLKIY